MCTDHSFSNEEISVPACLQCWKQVNSPFSFLLEHLQFKYHLKGAYCGCQHKGVQPHLPNPYRDNSNGHIILIAPAGIDCGFQCYISHHKVFLCKIWVLFFFLPLHRLTPRITPNKLPILYLKFYFLENSIREKSRLPNWGIRILFERNLGTMNRQSKNIFYEVYLMNGSIGLILEISKFVLISQNSIKVTWTISPK
jgi:hypothetical protein